MSIPFRILSSLYLNMNQQNSRFFSFGYVYVVNTNFDLHFVFQVTDKNGLFNLMFLDLDEHPEKIEGVGQLLFEMCKGVRNMFHSCTGKVNNWEEY